MENSKTARNFLGLNAGFSIVSGLILLVWAEFASDLLFATQASWQPMSLRILGVGLLLFGFDLTLMATNRFITPSQVKLISVMDVGWILASAGLVILASYWFTNIGLAVIIVVAVFVSVFAYGQYVGARKIRSPLSSAVVETSGEKIMAQVTREVNAPQDVVWRVMNDHPGYADVADNISKVEVVDGEGLGMQRRCYGPKGENWLETCDTYDDGETYGFRIHTEAADYPYPISDLHGKWSVKPSGKGSVFAIDIEARPKGNFLVKAMFKMAARRQFRAVLADLADAWAARMEREAIT